MALQDMERRIKYVDGLRGIAVLGVVVCHTWYVYPALQHNYWLNILLDSGRHGVELFFVLSGFCLSYPTLLALRTRGFAGFDVAKYGARRVVRILPPFWAAIAFCVIVLWLAHLAVQPPVTTKDLVWQALFLDKDTALVNQAFWTLAIEFRWYFLMPLALLVWVRWPKILGVTLFTIPILWLTRAQNTDLLFLPGFLLGIVAADVAIRGSTFTRYAPMAAAVLTVLALMLDPNRGTDLGGFNAVWMLASFCFVVAAGAFDWLKRICSLRWLTFIGLTSYSIYLVHQPVIQVFMHIGASPLWAFTISIAVGIGFWWVAERPWVETDLRRRATSLLQARFQYYLSWLGIKNAVIGLGHTEQKAPELVA